VSYGKKLQFLEVSKSQMYVYTQDIKKIYNGDGVSLPEITDKGTLDFFRSESNTLKLTESQSIIVAETKMKETLMETIPMTIT
jgi:hypothetical protein